jgi:hypothetical protein
MDLSTRRVEIGGIASSADGLWMVQDSLIALVPTVQSESSIGTSVSSFDILQAYLRAKAEFTEAEFDFIRTMFISRHLTAGRTIAAGR